MKIHISGKIYTIINSLMALIQEQQQNGYPELNQLFSDPNQFISEMATRDLDEN
jgi:hypothetical protein